MAINDTYRAQVALLLHIPHAATLPAVLWRQKNLDSIAVGKRAALESALEHIWRGNHENH